MLRGRNFTENFHSLTRLSVTFCLLHHVYNTAAHASYSFL